MLKFKTDEEKMKHYQSVAGFVDGLRGLAELYEANPNLPLPAGPRKFAVFMTDWPDARETAAEIVRVLGTVEKVPFSDAYFDLVKAFGPREDGVRLEFTFTRQDLCTRKVVGTRHVEAETKTITTPAHDEDVVEWDCPSLLDPVLPVQVGTPSLTHTDPQS